MAACMLRCDGCGSVFVGKRRHRRWCSDACRKATKRAFAANATVPEYEPFVLSRVRTGEIDYIDALDWTTDPDGARQHYLDKLTRAEDRAADRLAMA